MSEHKLQNDIRVALSQIGCTVFRMNVGVFYTKDGRIIPSSLPVGFSDLMAIKDGRVFFIEVKFGKNKPSPAQINFIEQMQKKGCGAGVAYSVEDAIKIIGT
jgi:hypothetical protein